MVLRLLPASLQIVKRIYKKRTVTLLVDPCTGAEDAGRARALRTVRVEVADLTRRDGAGRAVFHSHQRTPEKKAVVSPFADHKNAEKKARISPCLLAPVWPGLRPIFALGGKK